MISMRRILAKLALSAATFVLSNGLMTAQNEASLKQIAGDWLYRLGPHTLVALHLEVAGYSADRLHGYVLTPDHFSMNAPLPFSNIKGGDRSETVSSTGWNNGLLLLKEESATAKPEQLDSFSVRRIDADHIAFTLFQPLPPITMERATSKPELYHGWDSSRSYSPDDFLPDNAEMAAIVAADQADRKDGMHIDWQKVGRADAERRTRTADLLKRNELHT